MVRYYQKILGLGMGSYYPSTCTYTLIATIVAEAVYLRLEGRAKTCCSCTHAGSQDLGTIIIQFAHEDTPRVSVSGMECDMFQFGKRTSVFVVLSARWIPIRQIVPPGMECP